MNIRFYHAKILLTKADHTFEVAEGELWVRGDHICYIGDGTDTSAVCKEDDIIIWDREINAKGNLLMPGFKNAHTHTPMTFLRSFADDLPLHEWLTGHIFPAEARLVTAERGGYLLACNPRNYGVPDEWYHLKF